MRQLIIQRKLEEDALCEDFSKYATLGSSLDKLVTILKMYEVEYIQEWKKYVVFHSFLQISVHWFFSFVCSGRIETKDKTSNKLAEKNFFIKDEPHIPQVLIRNNIGLFTLQETDGELKVYLTVIVFIMT